MKYNDLRIQEKLTEGLHKHYGLIVVSLKFIPVGEESYAYLATTKNDGELFVKYCDHHDVVESIDRVNQLLLQLSHLPFLVPPIVISNQTSFKLVTGKMYVYPYIKGEIIHQGNHSFDQNLVEQLTEIMAAIHKTTSKVSIKLPEENFENDFIVRYERLVELARIGKLKPEVNNLFVENGNKIRNLINKHTTLAKKFKTLKPKLVLTHGDITGLNIIHSEDGLMLVDWDGAMFSPAERDINFLYDNPNFDIERYQELSGNPQFNPELVEYYRQDWALDSIIGNFESLNKEDKSKANESEYIEEIQEYLRDFR